MSSKNRKGRDSSPSSLLLWYNTPTPWIPKSTTQTNRNHHHFFMRIQICSHVLVHSVDIIHVVVVTVELIWLLVLNILFFNFFPMPNKSLRFTRFRRSYVNHTVVFPTNHCQSYTAFLLDVRFSKWPRSFFCRCLSPMIVHLRNLFLLSTRVARMLLTPRWVSRRKDVKYLCINISKLTVGVKHPINRRTTFSPDLHLVEKEVLECFPILQLIIIFPLHI